MEKYHLYRWQLARCLPYPEQTLYEQIRPIILFGQTPGERAEEFAGLPDKSKARKGPR